MEMISDQVSYQQIFWWQFAMNGKGMQYISWNIDAPLPFMLIVSVRCRFAYIRPKFVVLWYKMYSTDHNEIFAHVTTV